MQNSEFRSQNPEVRIQKSESRSQNPESRIQNGGSGPSARILNPEFLNFWLATTHATSLAHSRTDCLARRNAVCDPRCLEWFEGSHEDSRPNSGRLARHVQHKRRTVGEIYVSVSWPKK